MYHVYLVRRHGGEVLDQLERAAEARRGDRGGAGGRASPHVGLVVDQVARGNFVPVVAAGVGELHTMGAVTFV